MNLTREQIKDIADAVATAITRASAKVSDMLNAEEAAKYLGVSSSALYKMTSNKKIRHYKPNGKLCYFKREDLDRWMRSNPIASMEEIENEAQQYIAEHPNPVTKR